MSQQNNKACHPQEVSTVDWPLQFNPFLSSWKPVLQMQWKLPMVLLHICSQPPLLVSHSLMSGLKDVHKQWWHTQLGSLLQFLSYKYITAVNWILNMIIIRGLAWATLGYGNGTRRSTVPIREAMVPHNDHLQCLCVSVKTHCKVWKSLMSLSPKQLASVSLLTGEA